MLSVLSPKAQGSTQSAGHGDWADQKARMLLLLEAL